MGHIAASAAVLASCLITCCSAFSPANPPLPPTPLARGCSWGRPRVGTASGNLGGGVAISRLSAGATRQGRNGASGLSAILEVHADTWYGLSRPEVGSVLIAHEGEADHYFKEAAVLVVEHGKEGSRGVILEMATAFNVGEMVEKLKGTVFEGNPLFRGGSMGGDRVCFIHDVPDVQGSQPIGDSGLRIGGLESASRLVAEGVAHSEQFKFFFNQCEWVPGALERECEQGLWSVGKVPGELCLRQVSSKSDRPMEAKLKRRTPHEPLWAMMNGEIKAATPRGKVREVVERSAERPPVFLDAQKKFFTSMVIERIYALRSEKDAAGLVPLLDTGADVYGAQGNDAIEALWEAEFGEYEELSYLVNDNGIDVADDGTVVVDFVVWGVKKDGASVAEKRREQFTMSLYGMIRTLKAL